jgi:hypothetical protein
VAKQGHYTEAAYSARRNNMGWNDDQDDWRAAKRQREEEDYDRWYATREAEHDADVGRYNRPSYSQDAWETYDDVWQDRDSNNRAWANKNRSDDTTDPWDDEHSWDDSYDAGNYAGNDLVSGTYSGTTVTSTPRAVNQGRAKNGSVLGAIGVAVLLWLIAGIIIGSILGPRSGILGLIISGFFYQMWLFLGCMISDL